MNNDRQQSSDSFSEESIDLNVPDAKGNFPIISAINNDDLDVLSLMISNGANVNIDTGDGWTPLHEAFDCAIDGMVQNNKEAPYPEIIKTLKLLLDNGADPTLKSLKGKTPLDSLNTYSSNLKSFNLFKDIFRSLISDIDNKVQFDKKDS